MSSLNTTNSTFLVVDQSVLGTIYLGVSVSVMMTNGVIVFAIAKTREQHTSALWMVIIRAVVDFLFGFYYLIFATPSAFLNRFAYSDKMIGVASCLSTLLTGQTIFNITLTVLDRYVAVTRPLAYSSIVTTKVLILAICTSVVIGVIRLLLIILPDVDYYYNPEIALCVADFDTTVTLIASVGIPVITLVIIVVCSAVIFAEIRRGRRRVQPAGSAPHSDNAAKFPLMVMLSTSVFCMSYVPFVVSIFWNLIAKKENLPAVLIKVTTVALLSNSLWNVFIYTATYRPFRESLLRLFCTIYYRRKRRTEVQVVQNDQHYS